MLNKKRFPIRQTITCHAKISGNGTVYEVNIKLFKKIQAICVYHLSNNIILSVFFSTLLPRNFARWPITDGVILNSWWRLYTLSTDVISSCTQLAFEYYLARKLLKTVKLLIKRTCECHSLPITSAGCLHCDWVERSNWFSRKVLKEHLAEALCCIDLAEIYEKIRTGIDVYDENTLLTLCSRKPNTRARCHRLLNDVMKFFSLFPYDETDARWRLMFSIRHVCEGSRANNCGGGSRIFEGEQQSQGERQQW